MRVSVAVVQLAPEHGDVAANLDAIEEFTAAAAADGARVVVTSEMALTGVIGAGGERMRALAEPADGPSVRRLSRLCRKTGTWLVLGMPELDPDTGILYNSCVLVGPHGPAGSSRMASLDPADPFGSMDEHPPPLWDTPAGTLTSLSHVTADHPEPMRHAALRGADWVAVPSLRPPGPAPSAVWRLRAWENRLPLAIAAPYEEGMDGDTAAGLPGGSCVLDHMGGVMALVEPGAGYAVATLDLDTAAAARYERLSRRRYRAPAWNRPRLHPEREKPERDERPITGHVTVSVLNGPPAPLEPFPHASHRDDPRRSPADEPWPVLRDRGEDGPVPRIAPPPPGTELAVLPALHLTGGVAAPAAADRVLRVLRQWCAEHRCEAVTALGLEEDGAARFGVVLVDEHGVVARHLVERLGMRTTWAVPSREPQIPIKRPWGKLGLLAGVELEDSASARALATLGVELIAVSAGVGWPYPSPFSPVDGFPDPAFTHPARRLADEMRTWIAMANAGPIPGGVFAPDDGMALREEVIGPEAGWAQLYCTLRGRVSL